MLFCLEVSGKKERERPIILLCFCLISVENVSWVCAHVFSPLQSLPPLVCVVWRDVFDSVEVRRCWWAGKKNKESGIKTSQVEVIESGERNHSDLQGESGRLFVFLSNSLHNLHGCWQLYTAWKGLCLYLFSPCNEACFSSGLRSIYVPLTHSLAVHVIMIEP